MGRSLGSVVEVVGDEPSVAVGAGGSSARVAEVERVGSDEQWGTWRIVLELIPGRTFEDKSESESDVEHGGFIHPRPTSIALWAGRFCPQGLNAEHRPWLSVALDVGDGLEQGHAPTRLYLW